MRFAVTERDTALADAAGEVLAKQAGAEQIRAGWPGGRTESVDAVWRTLAGVGVTGALVPENTDGLGLDENALPPLMEIARPQRPTGPRRRDGGSRRSPARRRRRASTPLRTKGIGTAHGVPHP